MATIDDINALTWPCSSVDAQKSVMDTLAGYLDTLSNELVKSGIPFYLVQNNEPGPEDFKDAWVARGGTLPIPDMTTLYWVSASDYSLKGSFTFINSGVNFIAFDSPINKIDLTSITMDKRISGDQLVRGTRTQFLECYRSWYEGFEYLDTDNVWSDVVTVRFTPIVDSKVFIKRTFTFDHYPSPADTSSATEILFHYSVGFGGGQTMPEEPGYPDNTSTYPDGLWRANLSRLTSPFTIYWPISQVFTAHTEYYLNYGFTIESEATAANYRNILSVGDGYGVEILPNDLF